MKKIVQVIVLSIVTVSFTMTAIAQKQKSKDEYLKEITTLSNSKNPEEQEKAYELGKEFLSAYGNDNKNKDVPKVKKWVEQYQENKFYKAFDEKRFDDLFASGKEILAEKPDNPVIGMYMAYGGFEALATKQDRKYGDDSIKYAKLVLSEFEKGNLPKNFAPFDNKDYSIAWMYFIIGNFSKDSKESAINFYKATLYDTPIKKNSQPYYAIALYYEDLYAKLSADLKAKEGKVSEEEFKAETEKVNVIVDQMMDAYARTYTISVAEKNPGADEIKQRLAQVYQFRRQTDAGFDAYLKYVVVTPFKDPSTF